MNLHSVAVSAINAINPSITVTIQRSNGYTTNADGRQVPGYKPLRRVKAQVQAMSTSDLQHMDGLNISGTMKTIYLNGDLSAVVRAGQKGGDLITLPDGQTYLVVQVIEHWPSWTRVIGQLQVYDYQQ